MRLRQLAYYIVTPILAIGLTGCGGNGSLFSGGGSSGSGTGSGSGSGSGTGSGSPTTSNPAPTVTGIQPTGASAGSAAVTLTITGTGFITGTNGTTVNWGTANPPTTLAPAQGGTESATQLVVTVPASLLATAGQFPITVTNPTPGGGTSAAVQFQVTNPTPTITALNPASVATNFPGSLVVTVTGTGFVSGAGGSTVNFNGSAAANATVISSTQITLPLAQSQLTKPGVFPIVVSNATPGGGASNTFFFSVGGSSTGTGIAVVPEMITGPNGSAQTVDVAYVPIPAVGAVPAQVAIVQLDQLDPLPLLPINGFVTGSQDAPYNTGLATTAGNSNTFFNAIAGTADGGPVLNRLTSAGGGLPAGFAPSTTVYDPGNNQILIGSFSANEVLHVSLAAPPASQSVTGTYTVGAAGNAPFSGDDDCTGVCDIVVDNSGIAGQSIAIAAMPGGFVRFNPKDGSGQTTITGSIPGEQMGYSSTSTAWNLINPYYESNGNHGLQFIDLHSNNVLAMTNPVGTRPDSAVIDPLTQLAVIPDEGSGVNYYLNFFLNSGTAPSTQSVPSTSFTIGWNSSLCVNRPDWTLTAINPNSHVLFSGQEDTACVAATQLPSAPVTGSNGAAMAPPAPPASIFGRMTAPQGGAGTAATGYTLAPPFGDVSIPGLDPDHNGWSSFGDPHRLALFTSALNGQPTAVLPEAPVGFTCGATPANAGMWLAEANLETLLGAGNLAAPASLTNGEVNPAGMAQLVTYLRLLSPTPCIGGLNPNSFTQDAPASSMQINGVGFTAGTAVGSNCGAVTITSITPDQIVVSLSGNNFANLGNCTITVANDGGVTTAAGGGASSASFAVTK